MSKDLWFAEFERLYNKAAEKSEAAGKPVDDATYNALADKADRAYRERLADMGDEARLRKKEGP